MNKNIGFALLLISACTSPKIKREPMKPPIAKKIPKVIKQLSDERIDNYAWVRDKNWKELIQGKMNFANPEVEAYLKAEVAYTENQMADTKDIQNKIYEEVLGRLNENDETYPVKFKSYYYYKRDIKEKNYPIYCRKKGSLNAPEEIYFDVNKEAEGKKLYQLKAGDVSKDNKYYAYAYNLTGSLAGTIKVRDLSSGKDFDWEIPNTTSSFEWDIDHKHIFYVLRAENGRGKAVYRMNIFEGPKSKKLVYQKPASRENMFLWVSTTESHRFLSVNLAESGSREILVADLKTKDRELKLLASAQAGVEYSFTHSGDYLYILTNHDDAKDFKVMRTRISNPQKKYWQVFLSEEKGIYKESVSGYEGYLVLELKNNQKALPQIMVLDLISGKRDVIKMQEDAYSISFMGAEEFDTPSVRFSYQSPATPKQTIDYIFESGKSIIRKQKEVPNYNPSDFEVKREFADAHDGEKIPVTIMYKKGLELNGMNRVYQYAYGSYGNSMPAYFSAYRISLLERGFVFVIGHVRGGSDKGHKWYLDGKMMNKKNTFLDFISVSDHLIKRGYTKKKKIVASGGSAGGLLVGAVANMAPELYCTVVADVAFVDVINTISDPSLPLTPPEWLEWGNPIKNKEHYEYIKSYSPYDNVTAQDYPAMIFNSGISDEQVTYWEPTKMVAKLRELKTDDNLLLLNMKMHSGHAGASKKHEGIKEYAFDLAFILKTCK